VKRPTLDALVAAIEALVDERVELRLAELGVVASASTAYSQRDGQRPPWLPTRVLFLRAWGELHREGHPGCSAHGKLRLMSNDAALAWRDRTAGEPRRKAPALAPVAASNDAGSSIDAALGIRLRRSR
jgi:hypothetical protein